MVNNGVQSNEGFETRKAVMDENEDIKKCRHIEKWYFFHHINTFGDQKKTQLFGLT